MISDLTLMLSEIKSILQPKFTSVFTETKTKLSKSEFPAVIMTVDSGDISIVSDGSHNVDVTLTIDVMDSAQNIQEVLTTHTNSVVELLNPFVQINGLDAKAYPQSFAFSFDEEDSRTGTSSITYNISL